MTSFYYFTCLPRREHITLARQPPFLYRCLQLSPHGTQHSNITGAAADKVGDWLRQENAPDSQPSDMRQYQCQWDDDDPLTQDGEKDGELGFSLTNKDGLS